MRDKFIYLIKNTGMLFISNFTSKILVFLLVPFYTSILSTSEYGKYDLIFTTVQLISIIFTLNIIESVIRFSIGSNFETRQKVFTIGIKYSLFSIILCIIILLMMVNFNIKDFGFYDTFNFLMIYISFSLNSFTNQFTRGIEDIKGIAISGIIGTITMILLNILFLLYLQLGINGYFYAMSLSFFLPSIYLVFRNKLWVFISREYFNIVIGDFEKEMLHYCLPLIFITLSWYITNVSDRYVVTWFCGISQNGIYSVSYKVPAILNALQVIFIQAWQLSAIREYNTDNGEIFYRKIYQITNCVMVTLCSILIISTKLLARILFANEFYLAWRYVPMLLIYIVFNTLSGVVGGIFSASKDTPKLAVSGVIGALVNIILNIILVYKIGPMGAAIATVISSVTIWILRLLASKKYMTLKINIIRHIYQYIILFIQSIVLITDINMKFIIIFQMICLVFILILDKKEIGRIKNDTL